MKICKSSVVCSISVLFSLLCAAAYGDGDVKTLYLDGSGSALSEMAWHYFEGATQVPCGWIPGSYAIIPTYKNVRIDAAASGGSVLYGLEIGNSFFGYNQNTLLKVGEGGITVRYTGNSFKWDGNSTCSIVLTGDQTWTTANDLGSGVGLFVLPRNDQFSEADYQPGGTWSTVGTVTTDGPVKLSVTGKSELSFRANGDLDECDITVTAPATISVGSGFFTDQAFLDAKTLTLDGTTGTFCNTVASSDANQLNTARTLVLKNGATATFAAHAIFDATRVVVDAGAATLSGEPALPSEGPTLEIAAGATLNLSVTSSASFDAKGDVGQAMPLTGAGGIVQVSGFLHVVPAADFTGSIRVAGGTLALPSMSKWPVGLTVKTEGDGSVVLDSYDGYDPARLTGTAKLAKIVTDDEYPEGELEVLPGECVIVKGNGLTAAKSVSLYGGELRFVRTATIAAPIRVRGTGASVRTDRADVTATLAGFLSVTDLTTQVEFSLCGPGTNVLAGGGQIVGNAASSTYFTEGYGVISNGTVKLGWQNWATTPAGSFGVKGAKRLTVCDAGSIYLTELSGGGDTYLRVGSSAPEGGELVVADGGSVLLRNNTQFYVGNSAGQKGSVILDGGTVDVIGIGGSIQLGGAGNTGSGMITVRRGTFSTVRNLKGDDYCVGTCRVVLDGGIYKLLSDFGTSSTYSAPIVCKHNNGCFEVTEAGGVIDFSSVSETVTSITASPTDQASCAWTGAGTLRLVGRPSKPIEFVVSATANGTGMPTADLAYAPDQGVNLSFLGASGSTGVKVKGLRPLASAPTITARLSDGTALPLEVGALEFTDSMAHEPPIFVANGVLIDRVAVREGGAFAPGAYAAVDGMTIGDVAFDADAILWIPSGATQSLVPTGAVTLPETLAYFCARGARLPNPPVVMSGLDAAAPLPSWTTLPDSRKLEFRNVAGALTANGFGLVILLK